MLTQKYIPHYLAAIAGGLLTMLVLGMGVLHPVNDDMSSLKAQVEAQKPCPKGTCIPLLAPLGNSNTVTISTANTGGVSAAIGTFVAYFSDAFALLELIAVGFCVLWILIGGFYIMISGSDGGMRSTGKSIILWAVIGLVLTEFSGFFLKTLNSTFFK